MVEGVLLLDVDGYVFFNIKKSVLCLCCECKRKKVYVKKYFCVYVIWS